MAEKKKPAEAKRESQARTELTTVRLDQIGEKPELYCHRDKTVLSDDKLKLFAEQIVREGLQVPIEVTREPDGRFLLIKGHRRVAALRLNARRNVPGFHNDMEVQALLLLDATTADLLTRSVSDNENRLSLTAHEKIRAAKILYDNDISTARAASAMGISETSYERALTIAEAPWMFDLVADKCIDPTPAYELLKAARKAGRLKELAEDLADWVARTRLDIDKKARKKGDAGKELSEADRQVKKYMPAHLWKRWKKAIEAKQRFDDIDDTRWRYGAELDAESKKLSIPSVNLNIATAKFADLAEVAAKLDVISSSLKPYLQLKLVEERLTGGADAQAGTTEAYLRRIGMDEAADALARPQEAEPEPDRPSGEEARFEQELGDQIETGAHQGPEGDHE